MGARRPKAVLIKPGEHGYRSPEQRLADAAAEPMPAAVALALDAGTPYESLRIIGTVHKLRYANSPNLVEARDDQTVTFFALPYPHFRVMPSGVEIPLHNVASAIPHGASVAEKMSRTGRLKKRADRLASKMGARAASKAAIAAVVVREGVQEVPSDDDDLDDSLDDDELETEGGDDGIDV